jgi:hypothetical protein
MRRVELDYLAPARSPKWPGIVLLMVSLGVASELFMRYRELQAELTRLQLAGSLMPAQRRPAAPPSRERLDAEMRNAASVVRQLALPWAPLIQALEASATREVAILQLQPDAETRSVRLTAEARTREAMFAYLRRLAAAPVLADVHVVNHQVQRDDPQRPIQFSVLAALKPAPGVAR